MGGEQVYLKGVLAAAGLCLIAAPGAALADSYKVSFSQVRADDDGALRNAQIEAKLTPERGRIKMTRAANDSGLYHGWAGFVTHIEAEDVNGRALDLTYEHHGVWRVSGRPRGEVTLRYTMNLQHDRFMNEPGDNELAYARPYGVMWSARALFMEGAPSSDIKVKFDLPEGWKASTPWRQTIEDEAVFTPKDTNDLLDAAFMVGQHHETTIEMGAAKALIALGPPVEELTALFEPLIKGYFGAYTELFQDAPEDNFLLIGADASFLGGGVMGRTISLSLNEEALGPQMQLLAAYILAHEGFHLWNSKWGGQNKNLNELEWLSEGAAEYYAFLTSLRLGMFDEDAYFGLISERYGAYLSALDSGQSIVSAAATKNSSSDSYDLIYNGGMMVLLLIDLDIRRATQSEKSLDDVLRAIHRDYANSQKMMTLTSLRRLIKKETGVDINSLIRNNLQNVSPLDMVGAFAAFGLSAKIVDTEDGVKASVERVATPTPQQEKLYRDWVSGG